MAKQFILTPLGFMPIDMFGEDIPQWNPAPSSPAMPIMAHYETKHSLRFLLNPTVPFDQLDPNLFSDSTAGNMMVVDTTSIPASLNEEKAKVLRQTGTQMLLEAARLEEEETCGRKRKRATIVCDECRRSHLSCDGQPFWQTGGEKDCSQCKRRRLVCNFTPKPVKKPKIKNFFH